MVLIIFVLFYIYGFKRVNGYNIRIYWKKIKLVIIVKYKWLNRLL